MDSKRFKRKKSAPSHVELKFPELLNDKPYIGIFNEHNVSVIEKHAIHDIYNEGNFGKGSLSKSAPIRDVVDDVPEVLLQQQWENRKKWKTNSDHTKREDNKVSIDSLQNLLNSTYRECDSDSWKKRKENVIRECEAEGDEGKTEGSTTATGVSNETRNNDPLSNMVEEILLTGKVKEQKQSDQENMKTVLVLENCEDQLVTEKEFSLSNIRVKLKKCLCVKETLKLNLVEAFFLCFAVGRIKILNQDGVMMNIRELWKQFSKVEENFISKYVAYHYYRSHGWTVRSGIKFGGDYLLYKIGPAYYHASYLVWLLDKRKKKRMSWSEFVALNRLVETYNKDLLLCEILDSGEIDKDLTSPNALRQFSVLEVVSKRWIPSQERTEKSGMN